MKTLKRSLALVLTVILFMSTFAVCAEAATVSTTSTDYGYMALTDTKGTKVVSSTKLYGSYDYLNFYINSRYSDTYFFYEIYSDKNCTKLIAGDYTYCSDSGTYTWTPCIKLTGVFKKSGTYYCVTYAAKMDSKGNAKISEKSVSLMKIVVDRTTAFTKQATRMVAPVVTANGPQIKWYKHSNAATKYYIYRRPASGTKWTRIATVGASVRSYTDKSVKSKSGYYVYTVKAVNKKGQGSRYPYSIGYIAFLAAPVAKASTGADNSVLIKWNKVSSSSYRVYRKEAGGKWKQIKNTSSTSYYDKTPVNGKTYYYTVRAYKNGGAIMSAYHTGSPLTFTAAPEMLPITQTENNVQINWKTVSGAKSYTIYRKALDSNESWTKMGTAAKNVTSFIDTKSSLDGAYTYTVRAEGNKVRGSYSSAGYDYVVLNAPEISYTYADNGAYLTLNWDSCFGAQNYYVYKKTDGQWQKISKTVLTQHDVSQIGLNEYAVTAARVIAGNDTQTDLNASAISFYFFPRINLEYIYYTDKLSLSWNNAGYSAVNIYRKPTDAESYELIAENVQGTTYSDTTVEKNVSYNYIIKGVYEGVEQNENFKVYTVLPPAELPADRDVKIVQTLDTPHNSYDYLARVRFAGLQDGDIVYLKNDDGTLTKSTYGYFFGTLKNGAKKSFYIQFKVGNSFTALDAYTLDYTYTQPEILNTTSSLTDTAHILTWNGVENAEKYVVKSYDEVVKEITDNGSETFSVSFNKTKYETPLEYNRMSIEIHYKNGDVITQHPITNPNKT